MGKEYKDFIVEKILKVEQTKSVIAKANLVEGNIPYVTRTVSDNGYMGTCGNTDKVNKGNCITIGAETGVAFYQPVDFVAGNKVYRLSADELNEKHYLFLAGALNRLTKNYSYSNARIPEKIKKERILLPIKTDENGNPIIDDTHFYHDEGFVPDFDYMQERIEELEQERIEELEQERIEELEQYLVATGLNDYELTYEDIETLSLSGFGHYEERDSEEAVNICKEFKVSDLFELQKVSNKLAKEDLSDEYEYPAYSSDTGNNGIIGYADNPEFICDNKTPVYITFGDHTRTLNIARKSFSVLDNVKVLIPCYDNDEVLLYLTSEWQKQIPNLGYARHWKVAKDCVLSLPIQTDEENNPIIDTECKYHPDGYIPDWDFMEKYIKAIEKIVIADVVRYKDAMISKTKEVVA